MLPTSQLKFFKFPIVCKDTKEVVYSYKDYLYSVHWLKLKQRYFQSKLPKYCRRCRSKNKKFNVHHKTYKNLGNERLMDIIPLCEECHFKSHEIVSSNSSSRVSLWNAHKKGRKKHQLKAYSGFEFSENSLSSLDKNFLLSVPPSKRGWIYYDFFKKKSNSINPPHNWIQQQVSKACKWARSYTAECFDKISFEDFDFT